MAKVQSVCQRGSSTSIVDGTGTHVTCSMEGGYLHLWVFRVAKSGIQIETLGKQRKLLPRCAIAFPISPLAGVALASGSLHLLPSCVVILNHLERSTRQTVESHQQEITKVNVLMLRHISTKVDIRWRKCSKFC
jgi:hypothetical protein